MDAAKEAARCAMVRKFLDGMSLALCPGRYEPVPPPPEELAPPHPSSPGDRHDDGDGDGDAGGSGGPSARNSRKSKRNVSRKSRRSSTYSSESGDSNGAQRSPRDRSQTESLSGRETRRRKRCCYHEVIDVPDTRFVITAFLYERSSSRSSNGLREENVDPSNHQGNEDGENSNQNDEDEINNIPLPQYPRPPTPSYYEDFLDVEHIE